MADVSDVTSDMKIETGDPDDVVPGINSENVVKKAPVVGDGVTMVKDGISVFKQLTDPKSDADVADVSLGVASLANDAASFVKSASDTIADIATDPLGWLVGQGLSFLINAVQPVQDAIHFVSGDGPALGKAAENFGTIAKGLQDMAVNFAQVADQNLTAWQGDAANAARKGLAEFANGINGTAAKAGDLAQALQISSMIMTFIEELIKAILTEIITWLIMLWVPAIAAAVPTFGASTAAAGAATPPKLASTAAKTTGKVNRLRKLLQELLEWLRKVQSKLQSTRLGRIVLGDKNAVDGFAGRKGKGLVDSLYGEKGMFGSRLSKAHPVPNQTMDAVDLDATLHQEARRAIGEKILDETAKGANGAPI